MPSAKTLSEAALIAGAAAVSVWAVRGRTSSVFGPSVYRGAPGRQAIALTFDDGPTPSTPRFLECLARHRAPATFFQVGGNVLRYPSIAREVLAAGHEIGNHSHSHLNFAMKSASLIEDDFTRAQHSIQDVTGASPVLVRAPYGVRWFGFRGMQAKLGLQGVMWTVISRDWRLDGPAIVERVLRGSSDGGIICLHDGRATEANPDVTPAVDALTRIIPSLVEAGYHFETVSRLLSH